MLTAEAVIDLSALQQNYQKLKKQCGDNQLVAVIKGDAYGHGSVRVAQALPNADLFAVSRIEEAIELREAGITQPVLLLEGCFCAQDLQDAARLGFHTAIHCEEQLQDLEQTILSNPIRVWLKLDTGMHRLGIHPYEVADYVSRVEKCQNLAGEVGFMSHFSTADDPESTVTRAQIAQFSEQTAPYPGPKSLANSAGILYWNDAHFSVNRCGIALYGVSPTSGKQGSDHGLTPAMTLRSKLIAVRKHEAKQPVGYGQTWTSDRETTIGVVAMGYGDGYPRGIPAGTPVWINGRQVPIVGRVSMDMITVDLGPVSNDKAGDSVEFWGRHLPVEQIAETIGTIPYELMIQLTKRVRRTYQ